MENVTKRIGENVRALRRAGQDLKQGDVAARLTALGVPTRLNTVSRIERGDRTPDAVELLALATALGTSPNRLLLTDQARPDVDIELTPTTAVSEQVAWAWVHGEVPLQANEGAAPSETVASFRERSLPVQKNYQLPDVAPHWDAINSVVSLVRELSAERGVTPAALIAMARSVVLTPASQGVNQ